MTSIHSPGDLLGQKCSSQEAQKARTDAEDTQPAGAAVAANVASWWQEEDHLFQQRARSVGICMPVDNRLGRICGGICAPVVRYGPLGEEAHESCRRAIPPPPFEGLDECLCRSDGKNGGTPALRGGRQHSLSRR